MPFLEVAYIILPVFIIIGLGSLLRRIGLLDARFFFQANRLVYFVCLPILLFYKIGTADFHSNFNGTMVLGSSISLVAGCLLSYLYAWLRSYEPSEQGTFSQGAFRGNMAYIGLPLIFSAYGEAAFVRGGMLMGCLVPLINLLSILVLLMPHQRSQKKLEATRWLNDLFGNPLIIGAFSGLVWSYFSIPLPGVLAKAFDMTANVTLPLALIAIGGGFSLQRLRGDLSQALLSSVFKTIGLPLLTALVMIIFSVQGQDFGIAVIMAGAPTAAATYVTAHQLKGNAELAGSIIMLSTLLSLFSYTMLLWLLGNHFFG